MDFVMLQEALGEGKDGGLNLAMRYYSKILIVKITNLTVYNNTEIIKLL